MSFADDADDDGALLYGFLCVFDLEDTALGRAGIQVSIIHSSSVACYSLTLLQCDGVVVVVIAEHRGGIEMVLVL